MYVPRFQVLYGQRFMTCNIHLLLHLADNIKKFGPLWTMSCFPFENFNGILKSYVHGSRKPELQIYSAAKIFLRPDSGAYYFCKKIARSGTHRRNMHQIDENQFMVGVSVKIEIIPEYILDVSYQCNIEVNHQKCHFFRRLLKDNIYYESEFYSQNKKTNS